MFPGSSFLTLTKPKDLQMHQNRWLGYLPVYQVTLLVINRNKQCKQLYWKFCYYMANVGCYAILNKLSSLVLTIGFFYSWIWLLTISDWLLLVSIQEKRFKTGFPLVITLPEHACQVLRMTVLSQDSVVFTNRFINAILQLLITGQSQPVSVVFPPP